MIRLVPLFVALAVLPAPAWAAGPLQRYALVVGANAGGADRPLLRYAVTDAERFARVLVDVGGVAPGDQIVLKQPRLRELAEGLDLLARRVAEARRAGGANGGRIEIVVYYSGHADEKGLLLGDDRYSYQTLRDRLDQIAADVRIAVLDACSSGAFTRLKGGRARKPFMVDESSNMRGHAFLTSSAESEAAQESDRIRASYFTHYLVSGFRGAADTSGDGKVTLSEAYRFAFDETLGRTVHTRGGAQHPSYDIKLSGTGDVVMTDVNQTTATLVIGEELEGRFFVRNAAQELVVELYKPRGRRVELAVEAGTYDVRIEREKGALTANTAITDGSRIVLAASQFGVAAIEPAQSRGGPPILRYAVAGRNRLELLAGMWRSGDMSSRATVTAGFTATDAFGGLRYTRYVRENLAVTFSISGFDAASGTSAGSGFVSTGSTGAVALPVGVRWNPFKGEHRLQSLKPFLAVGVGPVIGSQSGTFISNGSVSTGNTTRATIGGHFGGGFDVHVARSFSFGLGVGYNAMANFSQPVAGYKNFNGLQVSLGIGWLFGKGYWSP
jgi:uncharacterized caspase-like protein